MIIVVILVVVVAIGGGVAFVLTRSRSDNGGSLGEAARGGSASPTPVSTEATIAPSAPPSPKPASKPDPSPEVTQTETPTPVHEAPIDSPAVDKPKKKVKKVKKAAVRPGPAVVDDNASNESDDDADDRFSPTPTLTPKSRSDDGPAAVAPVRHAMEEPLDDLRPPTTGVDVGAGATVPEVASTAAPTASGSAKPAGGEPEGAPAVPGTDLDASPLLIEDRPTDAVDPDDEPTPDGGESSLAEVVAELIDAADPDVADVMAKLIEASDPVLVAELVDDDDLAVAEVVARLVDAADPQVAGLVAELADAPDRRQVAEVLKLVDSSFDKADGGGGLDPEIAKKLEDLDIEKDLELTSRPGEMGQFAGLNNDDQMRVIIRVLVGLVAREDLPRSPEMPREPRSSAEGRRWPLSRARWPLPPPGDQPDVVKRDPLPARRDSSKAS